MRWRTYAEKADRKNIKRDMDTTNAVESELRTRSVDMRLDFEDGARVYSCPDCGADIVYDGSRKMLKCKGCGVLKVLGVVEKIKPKERTGIEKPNVIMTARRNEEKYLLEDLEGLGKFEGSEFRDVVIGEVDDMDEFLKELNSRTLPSLSRVAPVEKSLEYSVPDFKEKLSARLRIHANRIGSGESFKVSFTRRGLKGEVNSQEIEREMGSVIWNELEKQGKEPNVDLEDPDKTILIESLGESFFIGMVSREMEKRYYTLRFA